MGVGGLKPPTPKNSIGSKEEGGGGGERGKEEEEEGGRGRSPRIAGAGSVTGNNNSVAYIKDYCIVELPAGGHLTG